MQTAILWTRDRQSHGDVEGSVMEGLVEGVKTMEDRILLASDWQLTNLFSAP